MRHFADLQFYLLGAVRGHLGRSNSTVHQASFHVKLYQEEVVEAKGEQERKVISILDRAISKHGRDFVVQL
eukprot:COSAG05_NODE_14603_length_392_cov_1.058020_1_plen_71_part_00